METEHTQTLQESVLLMSLLIYFLLSSPQASASLFIPNLRHTTTCHKTCSPQLSRHRTDARPFAAMSATAEAISLSSLSLLSPAFSGKEGNWHQPRVDLVPYGKKCALVISKLVPLEDLEIILQFLT